MGEMEKEMDIQSGIRQGCTGSTVLFKLITYMIIEELEKKEKGFQNPLFNNKSLYYADDGLLLSQSIEDAQENINIITEASMAYGLEINKIKSNIITMNMKETPAEIGGIKVTDTIKYLEKKDRQQEELLQNT